MHAQAELFCAAERASTCRVFAVGCALLGCATRVCLTLRNNHQQPHTITPGHQIVLQLLASDQWSKVVTVGELV